MKRYYSLKTVDNIINRYSAREGFFAYVIPGCLLDGYIIGASGFKTVIIKELYLNEYSSGNTIRKYKKNSR